VAVGWADIRLVTLDPDDPLVATAAETAIVSESFGVSKPDPAIFREACSRAGVEPRRALHVGARP
jgi:FMN phosphatase YigB (HAD superfamily)